MATEVLATGRFFNPGLEVTAARMEGAVSGTLAAIWFARVGASLPILLLSAAPRKKK
jgi:hypothetical protein